MEHNKSPISRVIYKYILIFLGAIIAAVGLEMFLIPNSIIDGGIVGISIILSFVTNIPLGIFTFALNIPFMILGYKQIGKSFVIQSIFAITIFSISVSICHELPQVTDDVLLATVFGGIILGVGVGLILRSGGSLDGTEVIAMVLNKKSFFSIGQIVMIMNVGIFTIAAFLLGWDRAFYSMLAYFVAHKAIDVILQGFDEVKAVMIVSDNADEIAEAIMARLGRGVTYLEGRGAYSKDHKTVIYSVVTRIEVAKLYAIINDKDKNAFVTIHDVSDFKGGEHKKKSIH